MQPFNPPCPCPPLPQGFDIAKKAVLEYLDNFAEPADPSDRELLRCVARTSLRTKLHQVGGSGRRWPVGALGGGVEAKSGAQ